MTTLKRKFSGIFVKSFRFKVYLNFLTISIITVILMNIVLFQYFDYYMKKQIQVISHTKLENVSTIYNNKIEQYGKITQMIANMPKCISYIYSSKEDTLDAIDISNNLRPILSTDCCG